MNFPICAHGQNVSGGSEHRCRDRAAPGSMYCAEHRDAALRRTAAVYNARLAVTRGLRWRGLSTYQRGE